MSNSQISKLAYGTYKVSQLKVTGLIDAATTLGITNFDTAQLYGNEKLFKTLDEKFSVTTKIFHANTISQLINKIHKSQKRFFPRRINTLLLHREMPNEFWNCISDLLKEGTVDNIGVSNYSQDALISLLEYCKNNGLAKPQILQLEVHPFVNHLDLIALCRENEIKVQGHTCLLQGKNVYYGSNQIMKEISDLAIKYSVNTHQILLAWSLRHCDMVCFGTQDVSHMKQLVSNVDSFKLSDDEINRMNEWYKDFTYQFYKKAKDTLDIDIAVKTLTNDLEIAKTFNPDKTIVLGISNICDTIPITGHQFKTVGREIAARLFPNTNSENAHRKLRIEIKKLRNLKAEDNKKKKITRKGLKQCTDIRTEGTYFDFITNPVPMPVTVTDPKEFEPILNYVKGSDTVEKNITFVKGTMFSDGRLDMCKQVVGPDSIKQLCDATNMSKIVKHFLLGNNIAFETPKPENFEALQNVMSNNSLGIETWYLAGNCINEECCKYILEGLRNNTVATALWLKRNPIMLGAKYLNELLRVNSTLRLIDLHNCGLGNKGLELLFENSIEFKKLTNIYLDANAIEDVTPMLQWLSGGTVESLYLSINRLGDNNIIKIMEALSKNPNRCLTKRLCFSSTHIDNQGVKKIVEISKELPNLECLNLGTYKSSADLGEHPGNFFDDSVLEDLLNLVTTHQGLKYLSTAGSKMSTKASEILIEAAPHISMDLCNKFKHVHDNLKIIKHSELVLNIDSIYRGKM